MHFEQSSKDPRNKRTSGDDGNITVMSLNIWIIVAVDPTSPNTLGIPLSIRW